MTKRSEQIQLELQRILDTPIYRWNDECQPWLYGCDGQGNPKFVIDGTVHYPRDIIIKHFHRRDHRLQRSKRVPHCTIKKCINPRHMLWADSLAVAESDSGVRQQRYPGRGAVENFMISIMDRDIDDFGEDCIPWPFALGVGGFPLRWRGQEARSTIRDAFHPSLGRVKRSKNCSTRGCVNPRHMW